MTAPELRDWAIAYIAREGASAGFDYANKLAPTDPCSAAIVRAAAREAQVEIEAGWDKHGPRDFDPIGSITAILAP